MMLMKHAFSGTESATKGTATGLTSEICLWEEAEMPGMPRWNSQEPDASLIALWEFLHAQAQTMFLQAGTHLEILFIVGADGTLQPQPIAAPMTHDEITHMLREQLPGSSVYGLIHIGEAWAYIPKGKGDHTHKQLRLGEMGVSDLNADDKIDVLATSLLSRAGDTRARLDEILRETDSTATLGRCIQATDSRFPLGNVFIPAQPSEEDTRR
jgi:hypothetical protein